MDEGCFSTSCNVKVVDHDRLVQVGVIGIWAELERDLGIDRILDGRGVEGRPVMKMGIGLEVNGICLAVCRDPSVVLGLDAVASSGLTTALSAPCTANSVSYSCSNTPAPPPKDQSSAGSSETTTSLASVTNGRAWADDWAGASWAPALRWARSGA